MRVDRSILFALATNTSFERAVRAVPGGEGLTSRAAARYVAGTTVQDAFRTSRRLDAEGVACSIDQFGELVADHHTADQVAADYLRLAALLTDLPERRGCRSTCRTWAWTSTPHGVPSGSRRWRPRCPMGDASRSAPRTAAGPTRYSAACSMPQGVASPTGSGGTVSANMRHAPLVAQKLAGAGVHVRLVKGAYLGPAEHTLRFGEPTGCAFLQLAHQLAEADAEFALATHDSVLREALLASLGPVPVEQLLGVRADTLPDLVARKIPVRVCVPFGLNWFRYWMRRVAESRGA